MKLLVAAVFTVLFCMPTQSDAQTLVVGDLSGEDCSYFDEKTQSDSVSYYRRQPPFVGYLKGERLLAGGDGTGVLGLSKSSDSRRLTLIDGEKVPVYLAERGDGKGEVFVSRERTLKIERVVTGTESTCEPDADKCCGEYTYATLVVTKGKRKASVRVVSYAGG